MSNRGSGCRELNAGLPTIPPLQWHSSLLLLEWLWYHLSDRGLCHFTSKPIGEDEGTFKSFMAFNITQHGPVFKVVVRSQIVAPNNFNNFANLHLTDVSDFGGWMCKFDTFFFLSIIHIDTNTLRRWAIRSW